MSGTLGPEAPGSTGDVDWLHCTFELHLQHMENFENFTVKNEATPLTNCPHVRKSSGNSYEEAVRSYTVHSYQ